jgi:hypothetical protein
MPTAERQHQPEANINVGGRATTIAPELQYGLVDLGFAGVGFIPSWNVPGAVSRYATFEPNENAPYLIKPGPYREDHDRLPQGQHRQRVA